MDTLLEELEHVSKAHINKWAKKQAALPPVIAITIVISAHGNMTDHHSSRSFLAYKEINKDEIPSSL